MVGASYFTFGGSVGIFLSVILSSSSTFTREFTAVRGTFKWGDSSTIFQSMYSRDSFDAFSSGSTCTSTYACMGRSRGSFRLGRGFGTTLFTLWCSGVLFLSITSFFSLFTGREVITSNVMCVL